MLQKLGFGTISVGMDWINRIDGVILFRGVARNSALPPRKSSSP